MQVDRYHFFPASAKVWGGVSLLETGGDEPAGQGGMMAAAAAVLADVHDAFFDEHQQVRG